MTKGRSDSRVTSPLIQGLEELKVCDLYDVASSDWNNALIDSIFSAADASLVKSMPTLIRESDDNITWWRSRDGAYSVRSAYYAAMEDLIDNSHLRKQGDWLALWKMKVPQKVKLLMWRAARGVLPTRTNLQKKMVNCELNCPMCTGNDEDELHLFFDCPKAQEIWAHSGLQADTTQARATTDSFKDCFWTLLRSLPNSQMGACSMVFWAIWKVRNDKIWENVDTVAAGAVRRSMEFLWDWEVARKKHEPNLVVQQHRDTDVVRWLKPSVGELKCNVDAALFNQQGRYGIGMCIRNSLGEFVKAKTMNFNGIPLPQEAEAMGLKCAIEWLRGLGFQAVTIELDCLPVVNGITGTNNQNTDLGVIISSCKLLLSNCESYRISYIRRQANLVAHTLAKASRYYASSQVFDFRPTCIDTILMNEMN